MYLYVTPAPDPCNLRAFGYSFPHLYSNAWEPNRLQLSANNRRQKEHGVIAENRAIWWVCRPHRYVSFSIFANVLATLSCIDRLRKKVRAPRHFNGSTSLEVF